MNGWTWEPSPSSAAGKPQLLNGGAGVAPGLRAQGAFDIRTAVDAQGIVSVLGAAEEIGRCRTLEEILRRAVEVAHSDIGLERVALYMHDESGGSMRGGWASSGGELVDERGVLRPCGGADREAHRRVEAGLGRWLRLYDAPLRAFGADGAEAIGRGWLVLTPVRSPHAPIGILYNDAAISGAPFDDGKQVRLAVFASLLGSLIDAAIAPMPRPRPLFAGAKYGALVRKALAVLNEDPTVAADALAARVAVSPARLTRAFRAELGVSVVEYRNRLRLERFFGLVHRGGASLSDAASAAGFGSYAQFHRIFRQHLGVTPRDYLSSGAARSESERVSPSPKPHS